MQTKEKIFKVTQIKTITLNPNKKYETCFCQKFTISLILYAHYCVAILLCIAVVLGFIITIIVLKDFKLNKKRKKRKLE